MKFLLLAAFVLATTYVSAQQLPDVLIERAQRLIRRAEQDLRQHHESGRSHLTRQLEDEIRVIKQLERELLALEQHRQIESHIAHEVESRLLAHENRILELAYTIEHKHQSQLEQERERAELRLPQELIHRAQQVIRRAEDDLRRHHELGLQHLTESLEREIVLIRQLEKELLALEQQKYLNTPFAHELELRLLEHENRLQELSYTIEHQGLSEEEQRREREGREIPPQ